MTEPFDSLLAVQRHDTTVDQLRHRARSLRERTTLAEVVARRAEIDAQLAEIARQVDDLAGRQRALEDQIAAAAARRHELDDRMRTGAGYSARDLQAMDQEVSQLGRHQAALEEQELALLEEEEPLDAELSELRATAERLAAEAAELAAFVADQQAALDAEAGAEEGRRDEAAARVPDALLARYEALRQRKGGVGAAALVGDRCDGCHLVLPAVDLDRIRHLPPDEVVSCPECDRILVR